MRRFTPRFIQEWIELIRAEGLKSFIRQKGWKVVFAIFLFYLIRDGIVYLLIPYLIVNNIIQCQ